MHLPWVQLDRDALQRCRMLARLLGIPDPHGIGIAVSLWEYALTIAADGDFTGRVPDAESIGAAVAWAPAELDRLVRELQRVGFIATAPELRVRGLDRYRSAWERNRRNAAKYREKHKHPRQESGIPAGNPQPQTQTQTQKKDSATHGAPKKVRKLSAAEEFFAWLTARRLERTNHTDQAHTVAAVNAIFGRALVDVGRPQLELRYLAFLDEPDGASKEPPWPWRIFAGRWQTLKAPASQKPKALSAEERRGLYDTGAA